MFWIKYLQSLFKTLNANTSPNEIAAGVSMGAMLGLVPKGNLTGLFIWIVIMVFQVNIGMATAAIILFALLGMITDPLAERLGFFLLTGPDALKSVWRFLYNSPIIPFTDFNNTLVMGNLALGLILWLPIFWAMRRFVVVYRTRYQPIVMQWRIMKAFQASTLYDFWQRWTNR